MNKELNIKRISLKDRIGLASKSLELINELKDIEIIFSGTEDESKILECQKLLKEGFDMLLSEEFVEPKFVVMKENNPNLEI